MAIEVKTKAPRKLIEEITKMENVISASLVEHDGDVTA